MKKIFIISSAIIIVLIIVGVFLVYQYWMKRSQPINEADDYSSFNVSCVMGIDTLYDSGIKVDNTDDVKRAVDEWMTYLKTAVNRSDYADYLLGKDIKLYIDEKSVFYKGIEYWGLGFASSPPTPTDSAWGVPVFVGGDGKIIQLLPCI